MNGAKLKKQLVENGYKIDDLSKLVGIEEKELHSYLSCEEVPKHIMDKITNAIGKNVLILKEDVADTNIIEGDNNTLGNNNNNNGQTIASLIKLIKKRDQQIDVLLDLLKRSGS